LAELKNPRIRLHGLSASHDPKSSVDSREIHAPSFLLGLVCAHTAPLMARTGDHESPFERVSFAFKGVKQSTGTRSVTTFDSKFCTYSGLRRREGFIYFWSTVDVVDLLASNARPSISVLLWVFTLIILSIGLVKVDITRRYLMHRLRNVLKMNAAFMRRGADFQLLNSVQVARNVR
jgi:hypothetical protein